jgi:glyoxylase-like metal-dependent hydrolase (beta-lactamase superfamily II)
VSDPAAIQLGTIVSAPFGENTYIAKRAGRHDCLVFDPGLEPDLILEHLDREKITPAALMITHGHSDHIGGNGVLKDRWPVPLVIGRGDAPKLTDARLNLSADYGFEIVSPPADVLLDEGQIYRAAGFELEVLEIPGHSSGHVVYLCKGARPWIVFGGDVLFAGSIGRTDFPDGSFEDLASGIHRKLFTLPDDTLLLPGHGEPTTVGEEKQSNPFVGRPAGWRG